MKFSIIKEIKMKLFKKPFLLSIIFLTFVSCQSLKDGLSGNKQSNSDEFLVEKKNPLARPPEFSELPVPENEKTEEANDEFDLKKKLGKTIKKNNDKTNLSKEKSEIETLILKKINKN